MSRFHFSLRPRLWQRARRKALQRANFRCQKCGLAGRLEVDHIQPLQRGGAPYARANLQALCRDCHIRKTARENRRVLNPAEKLWRALVADLMPES